MGGKAAQPRERLRFHLVFVPPRPNRCDQETFHQETRGAASPHTVVPLVPLTSPVSVLLWGRNCPTRPWFFSRNVLLSYCYYSHSWVTSLHMRRGYQWTGRVSEDAPQTPHPDSSVPIRSGAQIKIQMFSWKCGMADLTGTEDLRMKDETGEVHICPPESCSVTVAHLTCTSQAHRREFSADL